MDDFTHIIVWFNAGALALNLLVMLAIIKSKNKQIEQLIDENINLHFRIFALKTELLLKEFCDNEKEEKDE